jgi:hypothetical protein
MRFRRADLPGILVAALAPAGLYVLVIAALGLWQHEGTPLLSVIATVVAVVLGVLATFTRFVRHWRVVVALFVATILDVALVIALQRTGHDWTAPALVLKLAGAALFLAANGAIAYEVVDWGVLPLLDRRARRSAHATNPADA